MQPPPPTLDLQATLARNLAHIQRRWPALAEAIEAADPPAIEHVFPGGNSAGRGTLRANGLQLSSAHDRAAEAALQAQRVPDGTPHATVYGLGMGDLARALLQRTELAGLRVVLLNPGVAKAGLAFSDNSDWLSDARLELCLGRAEREPREPFAAVPPALQLAADDCLVLRDALDVKLQEAFVTQRWNERAASAEQHMLENEELLLGDGDVGQVFGSALGARAIVVGPGPTLAAQLERLSARRPGATLIALSTALQPLLAAGLVPDGVVMIDFHSVHPLKAEQEQALRKIPLIYTPEVQRSTLEAWPGPRLACYLDRPRYAELRKRIPKANLWTAGTVAHTAVDLAVRLGCSEVMLFGLDFSYPGGESHAPGTPDHAQQLGRDQGRSVLDGLGGRVASDPNLTQYMHDLEDYIRRAANVRFTRADRRAAAMEGVQWLDD